MRFIRFLVEKGYFSTGGGDHTSRPIGHMISKYFWNQYLKEKTVINIPRGHCVSFGLERVGSPPQTLSAPNGIVFSEKKWINMPAPYIPMWSFEHHSSIDQFIITRMIAKYGNEQYLTMLLSDDFYFIRENGKCYTKELFSPKKINFPLLKGTLCKKT